MVLAHGATGQGDGAGQGSCDEHGATVFETLVMGVSGSATIGAGLGAAGITCGMEVVADHGQTGHIMAAPVGLRREGGAFVQSHTQGTPHFEMHALMHSVGPIVPGGAV